MDFLPPNYESPTGTSNYMKFKKGENKFRILSKPIIGWLDWKDKKPMRFEMDSKPKTPVDPTKAIKHFWAMIVWNYFEEAVQVLEVTQVSVQNAITAFAKDEDWGAPFTYDIKVTRTGEMMDTEYSVIASPKKVLTDVIKKAAMDKPCYLESLYANDDPWVVTDKQTELSFLDLPF